MLRRRIEGIKLQGTVADVDDIVPCSRRNKNGVIAVNARLLLQTVWARAHIDLRLAAFNSDELVNPVVHLDAYITASGNAHKS